MKQKQNTILILGLLALIVCFLQFEKLPGSVVNAAARKADLDAACQPRYSVSYQRVEQQRECMDLADTAGRANTRLQQSVQNRTRQMANSHKILIFLLAAEIFSYCVYSKRMFFACVQFSARLPVRFLYELFTLKKKDGKKRDFSIAV